MVWWRQTEKRYLNKKGVFQLYLLVLQPFGQPVRMFVCRQSFDILRNRTNVTTFSCFVFGVVFEHWHTLARSSALTRRGVPKVGSLIGDRLVVTDWHERQGGVCCTLACYQRISHPSRRYLLATRAAIQTLPPHRCADRMCLFVYFLAVTHTAGFVFPYPT